MVGDSETDGRCVNFRMRQNPKLKKKKKKYKDTIKFRNKQHEILEIVSVHGLLKCKTCERLWNRDLNGSLNIREIAVSIIHGNGRPLYLQRPISNKPRAAKSALPTKILTSACSKIKLTLKKC